MTVQGEDIGSGWLRYWDENEESYYYHHPGKGETTWEVPPECEAEKNAEVAESSGAAPADGASTTQPNAEDSAEQGQGRPRAEAAASASETPAHQGEDAEGSGESAQRSVAEPIGEGEKPGDGVGEGCDWDAYAKANGYGSAQEAYAAYYHYYYGGGQAASPQWHWGPNGWYQSGGWGHHAGPAHAGAGGGYTEAYAQAGHAGHAHAQHAAPAPAISGGGGMIYEPGERSREAVAESAAARLDRVLGKADDAAEGADAAAPREGELTEAQKIFGTGETFTLHAGLKRTADEVEADSGVAPTDAGFANFASEAEGPITAEQIAASARELQARALAGESSVTINPSDVARHGTVAFSAAREATLLNAVNQRAGGADPYRMTATFNKRTGRFEGSGQVLKMSVNDPRRQTSHYFDYDKWAEEKSTAKGGKAPSKKIRYE